MCGKTTLRHFKTAFNTIIVPIIGNNTIQSYEYYHFKKHKVMPVVLTLKTFFQMIRIRTRYLLAGQLNSSNGIILMLFKSITKPAWNY